MTRKLLERGELVLGLDNLNDYYDVQLKYARLAQLSSFKSFTFVKTDIATREALSRRQAHRPLQLRTHAPGLYQYDDIVEGVVRALDKPASPNANWSCDTPDPGTSSAPYRIYNIDSHRPVELSYVIELLEQALGKVAQKHLRPIQPGDVPAKYADVDDLIHDMDFKPDTPIEVGIQWFVKWYRAYHKLN